MFWIATFEKGLANLVDCMTALSRQFFYSRKASACFWLNEENKMSVPPIFSICSMEK